MSTPLLQSGKSMFRIKLHGELSMDNSEGYHSRALECAKMKGVLFAT